MLLDFFYQDICRNSCCLFIAVYFWGIRQCSTEETVDFLLSGICLLHSARPAQNVSQIVFLRCFFTHGILSADKSMFICENCKWKYFLMSQSSLQDIFMSHQGLNLVLSNFGGQNDLQHLQPKLKLETEHFIVFNSYFHFKSRELSMHLSTLSAESCALHNWWTCSFQARQP